MRRSKVRVVYNICLVIAVAGSWIAMFLFGKGSLAENGFGNLKYFTVLSNLLAGAAAAYWLAVSGREAEGRVSKSAEGRVSKSAEGNVSAKAGARMRAERLKYVAAAAGGLTFTTVMVFLGPLYGYPMMFTGANLFFHMIIPIAAMAEIVFLTDVSFSRRDNRLTIIPPLIYGAFYLLNNIINGIGEWPDTNDWYSFLAWGYPAGIAIFAVICAVTWLLGFAMRKLQKVAA